MSRISETISSRSALLTAIAMLAFAANSLLCRMALGQELIDAATFTSVRVVSGAVMLSLIVLFRGRTHEPNTADWRSAAMLFTYMAFFSFAYLSLSAGTGALILFGAVQLTMFITALREGEYFSYISWTGLTLAILGLIYLVSPGLTAPDPVGALLMIIAGIAWGAYSLLGRGTADPLKPLPETSSIRYRLFSSSLSFSSVITAARQAAWRWRRTMMLSSSTAE